MRNVGTPPRRERRLTAPTLRWSLRAAYLACASNLSGSLRDPAGRFIADLLGAQDDAGTPKGELWLWLMGTSGASHVPACVHAALLRALGRVMLGVGGGELERHATQYLEQVAGEADCARIAEDGRAIEGL